MTTAKTSARFLTAALAIAGIIGAGSAAAQTGRAPAPRQAEPNWYIGGGIGNAKIKDFDNTFLNLSGSTNTGLYRQDSAHTTYKVFVGRKLHPNLGMELGYMDLGVFGARRDFTAPATGTLSARIRTGGLYFDLVGWAPLAERFALFAKLGYLASNTRIDGDSTIAGVSAPMTKRRELNFKYGLGAQFNYNRALAFRAEWERITNVGNKNDYGFETNAEAITASVLYRF